jgi:hypothetical protein
MQSGYNINFSKSMSKLKLFELWIYIPHSTSEQRIWNMENLGIED